MKLWLVALVSFFGIAACGSADDTKDIFGSKICVAGATQECVCPGSVKGAQACLDDGSVWGACDCGGGSGAGGSAGGGQDAGGSAGAGGSCTPKTTCDVRGADGGAPTCGPTDDGCGGQLSCACFAGTCSAGACECWRVEWFDSGCEMTGDTRHKRAIACAQANSQPANCSFADPTNSGVGFPRNTFCCQ